MNHHLIYHLALASDWQQAQQADSYTMSTLGLTLDQVGFIHACFPSQIEGVAKRFYRDINESLLLLTIDIRRLSCDTKLECPDDVLEDAFPHIYGELPLDAVVAVNDYQSI